MYRSQRHEGYIKEKNYKYIETRLERGITYSQIITLKHTYIILLHIAIKVSPILLITITSTFDPTVRFRKSVLNLNFNILVYIMLLSMRLMSKVKGRNTNNFDK